MRRIPRLRPGLWDGAVVLAVAALAALLYVPLLHDSGSTEQMEAVIYLDGTEADRVRLAHTDAPERRSYTGNGYTIQVAFSDGVQVTEADCPSQDCVHTGYISRNGQSIICLPARIVIRLEGSSSDDTPDAFLG